MSCYSFGFFQYGIPLTNHLGKESHTIHQLGENSGLVDKVQYNRKYGQKTLLQLGVLYI